jgi:AraC family transcriptional regulator of adaptative response/methylated-DNA-[protein]-cysteine methyltransferase
LVVDGTQRPDHRATEDDMTVQATAAPTRGRAATTRDGVVALAFADSTLGAVLVASGAAGVRAVLLGDDHDVLRRDVARRLPGATFVEGDDAARALAARVATAIDAPEGAPEVPLDPHGTPFQRRVWQALREIPRGTTATYTEIAARLGMPTAARAVAAACAANPIAVVVPCHRVVRSDGGLSGYRWGVERKRALLERERREGEPRPSK